MNIENTPKDLYMRELYLISSGNLNSIETDGPRLIK